MIQCHSCLRLEGMDTSPKGRMRNGFIFGFVVQYFFMLRLAVNLVIVF